MPEEFDTLRRGRTESVNEVLNSTSRKKIVVAGPGTGKTYLFKRLAEQAGGNALAITFINNLADDLRNELQNLAESRTFHSLCKGLLHGLPVKGITNNFSYFPKLSGIISSDAHLLSGPCGDMDAPFQQLSEGEDRIEFYLQRGDYYDAVSPNDMVYRVIQVFRVEPDRIPAYNLIMVDEYQDFNKLEVELIDILADKSPILIVGDDDQALYTLKHASPDFLRQKYASSQFANFELPFSSRCPSVVIEAANRLIEKAQESGYLRNRVDKRSTCFLPDKYQDSMDNPKLIGVKCSVDQPNAPYMGMYIGHATKEIVDSGYRPVHEKNTCDFLIAGRRDLLPRIHEVLSQLFPKIEYRRTQDSSLSLYDCFAQLLDRDQSKIAWRALLEFESQRTRQRIVDLSSDRGTSIIQLIPHSIREFHQKTLSILSSIREGTEIDLTEEKWLEDAFREPIAAITSSSSLFPDGGEAEEDSGQNDNFRVTIATFMGCKGLQANYVFLVGFNDRFLPADPRCPSDYEICQAVVGMTRARKRCHLIYAGRLRGVPHRPSVFMDWIGDDLFERVEVNKDFFT